MDENLTKQSDLAQNQPNSVQIQGPNDTKCCSGLAQNDNEIERNRVIGLVNHRAVELFELTYYEKHWLDLILRPLDDPVYQKPLAGEKQLIMLRYYPVMRFFIRWSLYPATKSLSEFTNSLDPALPGFFDKLQKIINESPTDLKVLKRFLEDEYEAVADKLPPNFDGTILKLWDSLHIHYLAKEKSHLDPTVEQWSKVDLEKIIYSLIDSLVLQHFMKVSSNDEDTSFQVIQDINNETYVMMLGEAEETDSSPIGHTKVFKLFELSRENQRKLAQKGYSGVNTYGILIGGTKVTLFEFSHSQGKFHNTITGEDEQINKYNMRWIKDDNSNVTFTYCFDEFSKILKVLVALYNSLNGSQARIKYLIAHPEEISKTDYTTPSATYFYSDELDTAAEITSDEEFESDNDNINSSLYMDKEFQLSELFPTGSNLLGYEVEKERRRNINFLRNHVAKWCYAKGRSLPYEVEMISHFPLYTIPQPIKWASVDDDKYHVIVFPAQYHCAPTALRKFRYHAYEFLLTLQYIHEKGFVHGDIKMANSICDMDTDSFYLIDFDHACKLSEVLGHSFGTRGHRAPELILTGEYTIAAEMFSFGVWLIEWFFQKSVSAILAKFRPNFSIEHDELYAVDMLLQVFEEYADSKPYSELWPSHYSALNRIGNYSAPSSYYINEEQFQNLRVIIRDLLNKDPSKRPSCKELLTDPKYSVFLDTTKPTDLVIPIAKRETITKHVIYSPNYKRNK